MRQQFDRDEIRRQRMEHIARMEAMLADEAASAVAVVPEQEPDPKDGDDFLPETDDSAPAPPPENPFFEEVTDEVLAEEAPAPPSKQDAAMDVDLASLTRIELLELAKTTFGLSIHKDTKKDQIIAAIRAAAPAVEAGA